MCVFLGRAMNFFFLGGGIFCPQSRGGDRPPRPPVDPPLRLSPMQVQIRHP